MYLSSSIKQFLRFYKVLIEIGLHIFKTIQKELVFRMLINRTTISHSMSSTEQEEKIEEILLSMYIYEDIINDSI